MRKFADKLQAMDEVDVPEQKVEHDGLTKQRQDNVEYASMIYALDENVGRIMDKLDDLMLADNTHVIFTSDNGGRSTLYGPGDATANLPLRAGKGWLYEGGIRVPLIIKGAGTTGAKSVSEDLVLSTDFYPTILELVGGSLRNTQHVDGLSFVPTLEEAAQGARNTAYFHYPHYHGSASIPSSAMRSGDWKLVQFHESDVVELYDLGRDIGETENLATAEAERTQAMLIRLEQWKKGLGAGSAVTNPGYIEGAEQLRFRGLEQQ
jgi:arylsulfatase A-like enzyme